MLGQFQFFENSLVQIDSKLNSKPYDYLHKVNNAITLVLCNSTKALPWFLWLTETHPEISNFEKLVFSEEREICTPEINRLARTKKTLKQSDPLPEVL